ncbi:hypothetical protein G7Z17_g3878 [Cylindrodendrum hubeiense]|uniref:Major facilitator superfamily (MFS) profile domain-containing protein n=1 Tax=Cylindrodendrum hubeiense TaxID=595255 RepID=A0A9P5LHR0_9HYPO|nr:hypothetical protein G7Z17_g3878 [Cylindrodendrum hubeiense]
MAKSDNAAQPRTLLGVLKQTVNWYPSTLSGEERKLLFKVDVSLLVFLCLFFFLKMLDQTNINNAYVSGLKEDLNLEGNELNYLIICYNVPYVIFQIPGTLLLSRPKYTRWVLPALEILWAVLTFAQSRVTNINQLYALRVLIGMTEAPAFTGVHYVLGSWYGGSELFQRAGTWFICQPLGSMVSGYLQAAAHSNLNGVHGLEGWRWLFIVDGIFTLPVALIGFLIFPGLPESPKVFFFTDRDIELAKERNERNKISETAKITWGSFKRTLSTWHVYVFSACFTAMILSVYPTVYMSLWLKAEGYSVSQINKLPTGVNGIQIASSLIGTAVAAVYPAWTVVTFTTIFAVFGSICMIVWEIPTSLKFVAWYCFGTTAVQSPLLYSIANQFIKNDAEKRAIVMGSMMTISYAFNAWAPLLIYPTAGEYGAPQWKKGWPTALALFIVQWLLFLLAYVLHNRDEKRKVNERLENNTSTENEVGVIEETFSKST